MQKISFFKEDSAFPTTLKKTVFRAVATYIISKETSKSVEYINFIACSDSFVLTVNQNYLQHDYFTDIITFDYSEINIASDVYISIDRIKENAKINSVSLINELHRILIHGILHLVGYKDKTEAEKKIMTQKENYYLQLFS